MTTKTKYLVIALLLLVLVTTSVGLSTWNIHYQAVIGDIAYDTATQSSILNSYVYFGATDDADRAQANIQQNGSALYTYPIGYNTNSDGSVVFDGENYSTKREELFTYTYQSGKEYSPSVFVPSKDPSKEAIKGSQTYPANLFLDDSALDIGWGIEDVFTEIKWEYQYRLASVPFDTSHLEEDYKGNSDNYCEVNAVYYVENQITVYLSWKNGKGNHQGDGIRVDFVVDENGNESFTIRDKNNNELTAQEAKLELDSTTDFITIGVKGFKEYKFRRQNCGWTTDIPKDTGVWECRIIAKADEYEYIINKDANLRTDDEKSLVEAIDLLNSNTENDVDYATQVTYAVMPAPVSKQNTVTGYNDGTEKLQAKRSGTTRGTMPLAEENQQTQTAADEYVFTLGTGDAAISGTSFVYKGQGYNIEITADFQPTEGAAAISINYAEDQEKDAQDIVRHEDITSIDDHVYSTYGFSSDPNYIVTNPAVHYTIIKQEVKLTGWSGLETTYNREEQKVEPILENTHGEVTFSVSYQYQFSGGDVAKNAGIYTVTAELVDAVKDSGLSANYFLVNYYEEDGKEFSDTDFSATMTINKAPLTVTANNHEITYGDAFAHNGVTYGVKDGQEIKNGFIGTDNATNSLAGTLSIVSTTKGEIPGYDQSAAETRKVGNYTLIASGYEDIDDESGKPIYADDGKHNYTFTYVDGTLTVNQLVAEFSWSNLDPTYNGTAQKPVATVTNEPYDDDVSISVIGEKTNANVKVDENGNMVTNGESFVLTAEYIATADELTGAQAGNYTLEGASGLTQDFVIKPMSISGATITLGADLTYNGDEQTRGFTATIVLAESTPTLTENTDYLVTGHKGTNAFTYTLTITGQGNYYQTKTRDWKILKKELTVTADDVYVTYGDVITYKSTCTGFVKDEGLGNLAGEIAYISGYVRYQNIDNWDSTVNKGVYTIVASGYEDKDEDGNTIYVNDGKHNYTFTYKNGTLYVDKATIDNISVVGYTGTYDGAEHDSATKSAVTVNKQTLNWTLDIDKVRNVADSGTYNYKVTATNHYDATGTFTVKITPASIKVVVDDQEITYGDAAPEYAVTYTGLFGSDSLGTTASCDYTKGNDAGTYTITLSEKTNGNYVISNDSKTTATLTVKKAPNSITSLAIAGWTYGEYDATKNAPSATAQFGESFTFEYSSDGTNFSQTVPTNAGTYTLKVTVAETTNYESAEATTTFTIAKATVITPTIPSQEFTGKQLTPAISNTNLYTVTIPADAIYQVVGTYYITVTLIDSDNYKWATDANNAEVTVTFEITKANAVISDLTIEGWTYGEYDETKNAPSATSNFAIDFFYYKKADADDITYTTAVPSNAGTYVVKAIITDSYNVTGTSKTATFTIAKATVGTPAIQSKAYTGTTLTADLTDTTIYTVTTNAGGVDVGDYDVVLTLKDSSNYKWSTSDSTTVTIKFSITKGTNEITNWTTGGWIYGETVVTPTATAKFGTIVYYYKLETETEDKYTTTVPTNAGTYNVRATVAGTDNYDTVTSTYATTFTITPASIENAEITLDKTSLVYNGSEQTVSVTKVVLGEKELSASDYTVFDTSGTNADTYTVTVTGQGNYTGSANATFTINPASIENAEITLNKTSLVYTGSTQNVTVDSVVLGTTTLTVTTDYTVSDTSGTNADTYTVTVTGQGNYTGTATATFTINPASIENAEITLDKTSLVYTGSEHTVSVTKVVLGEKELSASDYTTQSVTETNAGTYTVTVTGTGNYTGTAIATFTIEQREVTLTWGNTQFEYNGSVQCPTATAGGLVGTDSCTVTVTGGQTNAGSDYTATATGLSNSNYKLPTNASTIYSIAKQEVEFTVGFVAGDEGTKENGVYTWAYNGNAHTLAVTSIIPSVALTLDKTITDVYWFSGSISFITANVIFADPNQANNYTIVGEKRVYLSVTPVKVRVSQQLLTFDYGNNPSGIAWSTIASNVVATTQVATGTQLVKEIKYTNTTDSALTKLEGNLTIGSTFKIVYEPTGNFEFLGVNYCYLKYQTVKYNSSYGTYGTIEEAIAGAGNITLVGNSTDENSHVVTSFSLIQNSTLFPEITLNYTLNGNRNLTVPYDSSNAAKKENGQINGDVVVSQFVYSALQIPADVVLNLEGNADIIVGAIIYYQQPNTTATGIHGVIMNNGTINVASGSTITSYGYIKGTGMINLASGSTATDCLHTYDWPGGSAAMDLYETVFPANAWSLHNISCPTKIYAGATYKGYMYVTASIITVSESVSIIGNGSSNNCMFQPDSTSPRTDSYILKYATSAAAANADKTSLTSITGSNQIAGQKDILEFHGDYVDTQFSISKTFLGQGVALQTSTSISLPTGFMDIHVKSNGTITLSKSDYLFMPGTKLVVDEGSTVVASSGVDANFATKADIESVNATDYSYRTYYVDKYDAYAVINGSLVIGAGCGISGLIKTNSASSFLDLSNANASIGYLLMYVNGAPKQFTGKIPYGTIDETENTNFSVGSNSIESIYVSAKNANGDGYHWTVSTQQASTYTVVLDYCDGTSTTTTYRFFGDPPKLDQLALGTPQKDYYTFDRWYTDPELTTPFTEQEVVDGGKYTYYTELIPTVYNVTYKLYSDELGKTELTAGFTNNSSEYYTITDALVLHEAIGGENMVFGGWYIVNPATADYIRLTDDNTTWPLTVGKAGEKIIGDITLGSTVKDIVLHATLKNLKKYTVTYMAQTDESSTVWNPLSVNASNSTIIEGNKISSILLSDIFDTDTYNYNNTFKYYFDTTTWYYDEACTNKFDANTVFNDVNLSGIVGTGNTLTLYAKRLSKDEVTITYMNNDGTDASTTQNAWTIPGGTATVTLNNNPTQTGYDFLGWYTAATDGTKVGDGGMEYSTQESVTLYAQWKIKTFTVTFDKNGGSEPSFTSITVNYGGTINPLPTAPDYSSWGTDYKLKGWYTAKRGGTQLTTSTEITSDITYYAQWDSSGCIAAGTLITMADGTTKKVEDLVAGDIVLVFNHYKGEYEFMPVIYNVHDYEDWDYYDILYLYFDDGTVIKTYAGHYFLDMSTIKYEKINVDNVAEYVGHSFYSADFDGTTYKAKTTKLIGYEVRNEYTGVYGPTTYGNLNCFAEGLLNIPADNDPFINTFVMNSDLKYDEELMAQDIETYGLYTYEDFRPYISDDIFKAYNGQYIKVAVGKGYTTFERVLELIERYLNDMGYGEDIPSTPTTTDVAEATLPPQVVTGDEQQQDTVEESIE